MRSRQVVDYLEVIPKRSSGPSRSKWIIILNAAREAASMGRRKKKKRQVSAHEPKQYFGCPTWNSRRTQFSTSSQQQVRKNRTRMPSMNSLGVLFRAALGLQPYRCPSLSILSRTEEPDAFDNQHTLSSRETTRINGVLGSWRT
jgi:hypothetical protein